MIVPPDFLDDYRMTMLVQALDNDQAAPLYVLRLWQHCQQKKAWTFGDIPPAGLVAVCRAPHEGNKFFDAMEASGFIEACGAGFSAPSWATLNAQLIAAWTNGRNGGRPTKTAPEKTHGKPDGIPTVNPAVIPTATQRKPDGEPIREEKRRKGRPSVDGQPPLPPAPPPTEAEKPAETPAAPTPAPAPEAPAVAPPAPSDGPSPKGVDLFGSSPGKPRKKPPAAALPSDVMRPDWFPATTWAEFLAYRLEMSGLNSKAPYTATAIKGAISYFDQCRAAGEAPDAAFARMSAHNWRVPYPDERRATIGHGGGARRLSQRDVDAARGEELGGGAAPSPAQGEPNAARRRGLEDAVDGEWRTPGKPASDGSGFD